MAWTAPMTAVSGAAFTAAQFNTHVRDNLLETGPAKVTGSNQFLISNGPNSLQAVSLQRPVQDVSTADLVFNNSSYLDGTSQSIPTVGVVFTARNSGMAFIIVSGLIGSNTAQNAAYLSFELLEGNVLGSGSQVLGPHGERGIASSEVVNSSQFARVGASFVYLQTSLTPGDSYNVRCMHVLSPGGLGTGGSISARQISVLPFW
jgi:hypothetical protein